jgi:hypothetical protein
MKKSKILFMETTQIDSSQTVGEIQQVLGKYGASAILTEYNNGEVTAVSFRVKFNAQDIPFRLPCRWEKILTILQARRKRRPYKRSIEVQARRVAWRQVLRWIEAQLALVDTEMVQIQEVFMPYLQMNTGQTLYEKLEETKFKMIEHK